MKKEYTLTELNTSPYPLLVVTNELRKHRNKIKIGLELKTGYGVFKVYRVFSDQVWINFNEEPFADIPLSDIKG